MRKDKHVIDTKYKCLADEWRHYNIRLLFSCNFIYNVLNHFHDFSSSLSWHFQLRSGTIDAEFSRCCSAVKRIPSADSSIYNGILSRSAKVLLSHIFSYEHSHFVRSSDFHSYGVVDVHIYSSHLRSVQDS